MSKYQSIAQQFITDIELGKLPANSKLPSLRKLTQLHNISMTTALACYRYLEQQGYADAQSQRGFYVQQPVALSSTTNFPYFKSSVSDKAYISKNKIIPGDTLATAQLDSRLVDREFLKQSFVATAKSTAFELNYEDPQGNQNLRHQLSQHFCEQGFITHQDELIITNGCLDAVSLALDTVSAAGDTIAVSSPCYSGLLDTLSTMKRKIIEIPSTPEGIDLSQLTELMAQGSIQACLFTANHQNPSGHSLSEQQKIQLAELLCRYQIPLIEDDVFRELSHCRAIPLPIKHYDKHGWVLWCSSVSKTLAPGLRLGWTIAGRYHQPLLALRTTRTLGVSQPIQQVMADYIAKGHYKRHVKAINRQLSGHLATYLRFFQQNLPQECQLFAPAGGMVLWVKFPGVDGEELAETLASQSVYVRAGSRFSTTNLYSEYVRLNIGVKPDEKIINQLLVLADVVKKSVSRV